MAKIKHKMEITEDVNKFLFFVERYVCFLGGSLNFEIQMN